MRRATRILFVYSGLEVGGAEHQLALLVRELRRRDSDVTVATLRLRGRYFDQLARAGIPTIHAGMRSRADVAGGIRAFRLWRTRPEIVVTNSFNAQVLGHLVARRAGAAHITVEQGGPGIWRLAGPYRRAIIRTVAPRVDRVVAVSASQVPELERLGYRSTAIRVIANAAPDVRAPEQEISIRSELGLTTEEFIVLLVASARPEKRVDRFLDAVLIAHARDSRIRGVVAGGGPLLEGLRQRAAETNGVVTLLGERSDVPSLIRAADAVSLSSDIEGSPLSAVEAMSLARPVVATDVGGMREIVRPGETGLLVRPNSNDLAQGILELAADRRRAREMGRNGHKSYLERFTVERMADAYEALFSEVVGDAAALAR